MASCRVIATSGNGSGVFYSIEMMMRDNPSVKNFIFATSLCTREAVGFCKTYPAPLCKGSWRGAFAP